MDRFEEVVDSARQNFGGNGKFEMDVKENYIWITSKKAYSCYGTEIYYNQDADSVDIVAHGEMSKERELADELGRRLFTISLRSRRF
jgi:hypothetical protein